MEDIISSRQDTLLSTRIFDFFAQILAHIQLLAQILAHIWLLLNILKFSFAQWNDSVLWPFTYEKKTKALNSEVLVNLNKQTETGTYIWFVGAWFRLGCGQTNLAELNVCSVNKENDPIIFEEEPSDPPPFPDIPEADPIYSLLWVNFVAVPDKESETPNKEDPPPVPNAPPNPEEVIPTTPDAD